MRIACITILLLLLAGSCSVRRMAVHMAEPVFDDLVVSLFAEPDLQLAEAALAADLKLIEGLRVSHDSERLAELNAMALTGYALFFCEEENQDRAGAFYMRATLAGNTLLGVNPHTLPADEFNTWLADEENLPGLFWSAFPEGLYIRMHLSDPAALYHLARVERMLARSAELDSAYFLAGAKLFQGVLDCARPRMLGGNPERGRRRLQEADALAPAGLLLAELLGGGGGGGGMVLLSGSAG